jgi:NAD(P)-dependent dehydrogenase (short-subunit alcohol dehydrogenase family)
MSSSDTLFRLDGRVALVTGASRGIGEAIATAYAAHGAKVVLAARKLAELEQVAGRITAAGGTALPVACHTGKPEEVKALVERAIAAFGGCDILVNNAATNPYFGPLIGTSDAAFDKTFEVNVKGYFFAAREVIRHLQERLNAKPGSPAGTVINIASSAGLRAAPFQGAYGMTKAAVISMTQTLAAEVGGQGIRVNAIAPGLVETRFAAAIVNNDALRAHVIAKTPLGRHAQPSELVGAALFLASDASSYVNGHTLVVDGGMTIS